MPPRGKNELERFVDKYGYNIIWSAITARLLDGSGDYIDDGVTNLKPDDMFLKFTRNLTVDGCCFEFDGYMTYIAVLTTNMAKNNVKGAGSLSIARRKWTTR